MPKDKTETHKKIVAAAKAEFLEKGFEQASMRNIAAQVGMSAAGIYRHFEDKEAMFAALVDPVLEECSRRYEQHKRWDYEQLDQNNLDAMWESGTDAEMILTLVYEYLDEFKLLLCCSEGTRYTHFIHDLVMLEQKETEDYMAVAKQRGVPVREIRSEELHLLLSAYVTAMFETVIHDFSREEAEHYMVTLHEFFSPGWRAVLGL